MSNIIPPLLSDSPPPIITPEDEEDEFGDFNSAVEVSYGYENLSLPSTPQHEPLEDVTKIENFDINSNTDNIKDIKYKNQINGLFSIHIDKDFQDKRKSCDITTALNKTDVNLPKSECEEKTVYNVNFYENSDISCNGDHHAEKLKNFKDVEGGVLPNESVPIDTLIQNQLLETENENIHKSIDEINMKNENIIISVTEFSANVPCSTNENLLDTLKTDTKKINVLRIDSSLNNESRVTNLCNSGLESSEIVPNKVGANEDNVEKKSSTTMKEFYFIEEPPDLHVVDDSKVQVEDFCYYDAYEDEHNLDKHNFEISNKMNETCNEDSSISKMEDAVESLRALSETLDECNDNSVQDEKTSSSQSSNDERIKKYVDDLEKVEFTFATLNDASDINNENNLTNVSICKNNSHEFNKLSDNAGSLPTEELVKNNSEISLNTKANESIHIIAEDETNEAIITEVVNHFEEPNDTVDNFCDFQEIKISTPIEVVKFNDIVSDATNNDISEFSDFVDFARFDDSNLVNEFTTDVEKLENNFTEISSHSNQTSVEPTFSDEEDEFGDFGDYTQTKFNITVNAGHATSTTTAPIMKINREDILQNVERIVLEMYPPCEVSYDKFVCADVLRTDSVFKSVKDVTETNALIYQWTKSTSQDKLLSALNIDTRNILYGAGWNPMMPRYAANLGSAPLEPIKSGDIGPSSSHIDSIHVQSSPSTVTQVDIPNAQFDWSGSGLINPLDSQPKDNSQRNNDQDFTLDQLEKNTDNLTPVLRARFHSDNESVKSLQLTTDTIQDAEETSASKSESNTATFENDSFDEFTSYQSHKSVAFTPSCLSNTIPLRETYISGNCSTSDEFLQKNGEKIESNVSGKIEDGDEEFSDFQTGLPILSTVQKEPDKRGSSSFQDEFSVVNKNCGPGLQHVLEPLKPVVMINVNKEVAKEQTQINWPNPGIIDEDILNIELSYSRKQSIPLEVEKTVDEPNISNKASEIAKQQGIRCDMPKSFPDFAQLNKNKKDLISNSSSDNQKKDKQHIRNDKSKFSQVWNSAPNQIAKGSDDDDWSDFICNPEPMKPPIEQRNILRQPEKTYTPEIRLSVPHLSQLQQPKKPIPVITPRGLIQTRIPSNINSLSNRNVQQPSSILQNQFKNTFQPSTISQQYQSHMNGSPFIKSNVNGYNGIIPQQQVKHNQYPPSTNVGKTAGGDDDDDWTEFISSPPVQPTKKPVNNFSQISNSPRTNTVSNSSAMPNIITNPVHFDYSLHKGKNNFGPHAKNVSRKSPNVNFGSATTSIPSISALPDLDFVGPKSRTFSKK